MNRGDDFVSGKGRIISVKFLVIPNVCLGSFPSDTAGGGGEPRDTHPAGAAAGTSPAEKKKCEAGGPPGGRGPGDRREARPMCVYRTSSTE